MTSHYEFTWDEYSRWWDSAIGLSGKFKFLGDEWGDDSWVSSLVEQYGLPYLNPESTVLEIGPGGGRYTAQLEKHCELLICVDVSALMLDRVRRRFSKRKRSSLIKGSGHDLAGVPDGLVDFVWSSNVFVQLAFEDIASYLSEIQRVLKPGGRAALHYATISSEDGWKYFQSHCRDWSRDRSVRGRFCELTLETMKVLADRFGMVVVKNETLGRDAMLVIKKPARKESLAPARPDAPAAQPFRHSPIRQLLHSRSPYAGFPLEEYPEDLQGWHSRHPMIKQVIEETLPELVIEVGSWKGGSAIYMGELMQRHHLQGAIVCVDTWLGALEFWDDHNDPERYQALKHRFGYPTVYYQFLANVIHHDLQDVIVPFPQASCIAARWFATHRVKADLIYVDASHDEPDVAADLRAYWPLVKEGGIMFGDDYDEFWPGLVRAVQVFANEEGVEIEEQEGFWKIRKPATGIDPKETSVERFVETVA